MKWAERKVYLTGYCDISELIKICAKLNRLGYDYYDETTQTLSVWELKNKHPEPLDLNDRFSKLVRSGYIYIFGEVDDRFKILNIEKTIANILHITQITREDLSRLLYEKKRRP